MEQARTLLKSLVIIGAILGSVLGIVGTCVPWLFPNIFTPDRKIIQEVGSILFELFKLFSISISFVAMIYNWCFSIFIKGRIKLGLWLLSELYHHFIISAAFYQFTVSGCDYCFYYESSPFNVQ